MRHEMNNGWLLFADEPKSDMIQMFNTAINMGCSADITIMTEKPEQNRLVVHGDDKSMKEFERMMELMGLPASEGQLCGVYDVEAQLLSEHNSLILATKEAERLADQWMNKRKGIYYRKTKVNVTGVQNEVLIYSGREKDGGNDIVTGFVAEVRNP